MENEIFAKIVRQAVIDGDMKSIEILIEEYGAVINKYSCSNGSIDEDCRQYIKMQIIKNINKFKNVH